MYSILKNIYLISENVIGNQKTCIKYNNMSMDIKKHVLIIKKHVFNTEKHIFLISEIVKRY